LKIAVDDFRSPTLLFGFERGSGVGRLHHRRRRRGYQIGVAQEKIPMDISRRT
jgi:hypothetical protein